jgi:C1A family cysteine protease
MKKKIVHLIAFLLVLLIAKQGLALDATEINQAIRDKGANWIAGETSMSKLSPEELKLRLMPLSFIKTGPKAKVNLSSPKIETKIDLPARFDWRNYNGHNYVTGVRDQDKCGACYAFSTAAALESRILITSHTPDRDLNLSEQAMVSCDERNYGCGGGYLDYALDYLAATGLPTETCYPFTSAESGITGECGGCSDWQQNTYKITGYENVATSVEDMKRALIQYGPLVAGFLIFQDFLNYKSGVYTHVTGTVVAGHAVLIVGYDDTQQAWIVKNSVGTDWGENGFFRVKSGTNESLIETEVYAINYATVPGFSFVLSPSSADFGTLLLPDQPSKTIPFTITNNGSLPLTNTSCSVTNRKFSVTSPAVPTLESTASAEVQVTYTAQAGKTIDTGELRVVSSGITHKSSLTAQANTRPDQPVNQSPANGATVQLPVKLVASEFTDDDGDSHMASQWIILNSESISVYSGTFDYRNKTSFTVPSGMLQVDTQYYWQVIYLDDRGGESLASAPTSFTTEQPKPEAGGSTTCFIATAAFGSPLAGQVEILRQFRDRYLLTNYPGQKFVAWYYRNGPAAANFIKDKPLVKAATRVALYPLIGFSLLLISGYLPFVIAGLLLATLLLFRFRPKKLNAA